MTHPLFDVMIVFLWGVAAGFAAGYDFGHADAIKKSKVASRAAEGEE